MSYKDLLAHIQELVILKGGMNYQIELMEYIESMYQPTILQKKQYAEVNTPKALRDDMLQKFVDYVPDFFNYVHTVFEPCCGKGLFLLDIVHRFMIGLQNIYPDEEERYRIIVEKCLFWADINADNIEFCRIILDPFSQYHLQYYQGDVIQVCISDYFNIASFDLVISNPPYNAHGKTATGNAIWHLFVQHAITEWLKKRNSYLVYVHPPGWRKPKKEDSKYYGLYDLMTHINTLLYLEMHDIKDGLKIFGCGTRYDWYIMSTGTKPDFLTTIKDYTGKLEYVNLHNIQFIPNYNINDIQRYILSNNDDRTKLCQVLYSRTKYASDKSWISNVQSDKYPNIIIHSTAKSGIRYIYSKHTENGHFGIPKLIFGDSGIYNCIIDYKGAYGMSEHAIGLIGYTPNEMLEIKQILESPMFFETFIKPCMWSNFQIDWRLFSYLRKDFYKYI